MQEVSSLMMVPKLRVLKPLLEVSVLWDDSSARVPHHREYKRTFHAWDHTPM
jgi:hypothetical protein